MKTCLTLAACGLLAALPAAAQLPSRTEIAPLRSRTLTGEEFLRGNASDAEAMLAGALRLPPGAAPSVPAVVLVHGSGGIGPSVESWARELNGIGVAAYILDSFTGRGIVSTVENQDQLNSLAMMVDAYRALDMLAAHPRIRADRIAIMGFSKGAVAAVYSAMDRFRGLYGSPEHRFAAHIGMYTPCNVRYAEDTKLAPLPVRFYHGAADDYVPVAPCRDYVARLREAGVDVQLTEYPDAQHSFDNPASARLVPLPRAQSTRECRLAEGPDGRIRNVKTGADYSIRTDPCVATGAHVGYNPEATAAVQVAVKAFLTETLLK